VHVLQRGADVDDIVNIATIAVVDAQEASKRGAVSTPEIAAIEVK
jgi:hypothetical protein